MPRTRPTCDQINFDSARQSRRINLDLWLENLEQQVDALALRPPSRDPGRALLQYMHAPLIARTLPQSPAAGQRVLCDLRQVDYDPDSAYDSVGLTYTAPATGAYITYAWLDWPAGTASPETFLVLDGITEQRDVREDAHLVGLWHFDAGTRVQLACEHAGAIANLPLHAGGLRIGRML